jgi:hypothetical protein
MTTVDILVFEVAGVRFGADASQVIRIDRPIEEPSVGAPLGMPHEGRRALVFKALSGELRRLDIDKVAGVKTVSIESLRRLPPPARVGQVPIPIGAWLDGDEAVLLVDLQRMAS